MVPAERQIQPGLYQHEKDQKLISEIMSHPMTETVFQWLRDQNLHVRLPGILRPPFPRKRFGCDPDPGARLRPVRLRGGSGNLSYSRL